jgi:hypothetical protein
MKDDWVISEMQVDKTPFPIHTLELNNPKVLLQPEQAEGAQGKNVVIGDPRPMDANDKILAREVVAKKTPDGKPTLRIFVNAPMPGGQASSSSQPAVQAQPVRPVASTGQIGPGSSPGLSNQNVRKRLLGKQMCQRYKKGVQIKDLPLDNC